MLSFSGTTWSPPSPPSSRSARRPSAVPTGTTSTAGGSRVASRILPRLYLSDFLAATHEPTLRRLRVTHRVSVCECAPALPAALAGGVHTLHVRVADRPDADLLAHLARTSAFIADALADADSVVLVHCMMGISRSATVVAAYLLATRPAMSVPDALAFVRARRGIVAPNSGFVRQLELCAGQRGGGATGVAVAAEDEGSETAEIEVRQTQQDEKVSRWAELGIRERMRRLRVATSGLRKGGTVAATPG